MTRIHWVPRGTGTPKDKDEVYKRESCECDGRVCNFGQIRASSTPEVWVCLFVYYESIKREPKIRGI
jgi:hypothetical protein